MTTFVFDKQDDGIRTARNAPSGRCARAGTVARLFEARQSAAVRACETASAAPRAKHGYVPIATLTLDPIAGL